MPSSRPSLVKACGAALLGLGVAGPVLLGPVRAQAIELRGSTVFLRAPWKVDLISYTTTVGQTWAEYFFTLELPADAGASLGELLIRQTRGVDTDFPFSADQTRAFVGRPRRQGAAIPVTAQFSQQERLMRVQFPQPVPPGTTLTVRLRPWTNPGAADTYMFQVTAFPSGPDPSPAPLGYGTLRIYMPDRW